MPVKLLTSGGGGVNLVPSSSIASDQTIYLPTSGTSGGTVLCIDSSGGTANGVLYLNGSKQVTSGSGLVFDASGNLLVGTTSAIGSGKVCVVGTESISTKGGWGSNAGSWHMYRADSGVKAWQIHGDSDNLYIADGDFSNYAFLSQNPTAWQWGSDRRIKTDIVDLDYGLSTVLSMRPRRYKFISSGKIDIGFIAQEIQTIVPEAVTGEEITFDDADTPQERANKTMGVGKETLIPILVKAIQEQQAIIESLTQRIEALEYTKQGE